MPLIEDVLTQLGKSSWFSTLDLQLGFWQIKMADEDVYMIVVVIKTRFFEWNVMPFKLKNATNTFSKPMAKVFMKWSDQLFKFFMNDVNVHNKD
jgi:hypothetical protein